MVTSHIIATYAVKMSSNIQLTDKNISGGFLSGFVNGKMIVYDSNGKKVYEGLYYGDMKSGFLCHEPMEGMAGFFKEVDSNGQLK